MSKKSIKIHFKGLGYMKKHSSWVVKVNDNYSAKSKICSKKFYIGSMGVKVFETHAKGEKFKQHQLYKDSGSRITSQLTKIDEIQSSSKGKLPTQKQERVFTVTDNQLAKQAEVIGLKLLCASSPSVHVAANQNYFHPCSWIAALQKILLVSKESVNMSCVSE